MIDQSCRRLRKKYLMNMYKYTKEITESKHNIMSVIFNHVSNGSFIELVNTLRYSYSKEEFITKFRLNEIKFPGNIIKTLEL